MDIFDVEENCNLYNFILKLMSFRWVGQANAHKHAYRSNSKNKMLSLMEFLMCCIYNAFKSGKNQATGFSAL